MTKRKEPLPSVRVIMRDPLCLVAFGFGTGFSPFMPGTVGTLLGIPIYWSLAGLSLLSVCLIVGVLALAGIAICEHAIKTLKVGDHPGIVWDEVVGFLVAVVGLPFNWLNVALVFLLFRAFDIVKPWPISWADRRVGGGFGIMLDDLIAGAFTWLVLYGLRAW